MLRFPLLPKPLQNKNFLHVIMLGQKTSVLYRKFGKYLLAVRQKVTTVVVFFCSLEARTSEVSWISCWQAVPGLSLVCFEMFWFKKK